MRFLATYILLQMGGNANPTKDDIIRALSSVGIVVNDEDCLQLDRVIADMEGKHLDEILREGQGSILAGAFAGVRHKSDARADSQGNIDGSDASSHGGQDEAKQQSSVHEKKADEDEEPTIECPATMFDKGGESGGC